jgi:hypothetical protein
MKHLPEVTVCSSQDPINDQYPMPAPDKEESGQSRPKAMALMEILRVNALMYSNLESGDLQWYLLRIGRRDLDGNNKARVIHYGSMKAIEVTAERQSPEIFEATSPVVKILWSEDSGGGDDASVMDPLDRMLPIQTGQIVQV